MVTPTRAHRVGDAFVKLAEALVGDYDVVDLLQSLVESSVDLLDAAAAGLVLADPEGGLQVGAPVIAGRNSPLPPSRRHSGQCTPFRSGYTDPPSER